MLENGVGWFQGTTPSSISDVTTWRSGFSDGTTESEIDIPFYFLVPKEELTSLEYWSRDDQIWKMSDALMAQFQRHGFIQIPEQDTQPMLVTFVRRHGVYPKDFISYQREFHENVEAFPIAEVDGLLEVEREQIKARAIEYLASPTQTVDRKRKGILQ